MASLNEFMKIHIPEVAENLRNQLQYLLDNKAKPVGSLGIMEEIALRLGMIQNTETPVLNKPIMLTVAADHGVTAEGVSPCPTELTWQQVLNFLQGGGGIGLFCQIYGLDLWVADAGVNYDFAPQPRLIDVKIAHGSANLLHQPAMTRQQCEQAIENGRKIVRGFAEQGSNVIGFGEMGIGNTTPASALLSIYAGIEVKEAVGPGAGLDANGVSHKARVIAQSIAKHGIADNPIDNLARFGGLEIATICGGMLEAAAQRMAIITDGFITTSALLIAREINPRVTDYTFYAHQSDEQGHRKMIETLGGKPILHLGLRLGEGTGAAVAYSVMRGSAAILSNMTSFEQGGVTNTSQIGAFARN